MSARNKFLIFLLSFIPGILAGDHCDIDGIYSYCPGGCCGSGYDKYCCLNGDIGNVVGTVIGCLFGLVVIVTVIMIIYCCCRRGPRAGGRILTHTNTTMATTTMANTSSVGGPVQTPAYPGTYAVGQPSQNFGFTEPYVQQADLPPYHTLGCSYPYTPYTVGGYQNTDIPKTNPPEPYAQFNDPNIDKPPPYSELP